MSAAPAPRGDRVSASVFVDAPPPVAFEVFTDQIDRWWRHGLKFRVGARGTSVLHLEPRPAAGCSSRSRLPPARW